MRCMQIITTTVVLALVSASVQADDWAAFREAEPMPEWMRDAKLGIYMHWGVYSVPAYGNEWYPRHMHDERNATFRHHKRNWGHPTEFGYHDFVPLFTAEHYDPEEWAKLFKQAGARFAGLVSEHHDGFALWDSELTPWNSVDRGPKRDITGELGAALRAEGMRFVTTFHHARNSQHQIQLGRSKQWTGHYPRVEGWPTASDDPELQLLYGNLPREQFLDLWLGKLREVIDQYEPDIIYFDSWLHEIPDQYRLDFLEYYHANARERGVDVAVTYKQHDLPWSTGVPDYEKGRMNRRTEYAWLTDDTLSTGSWCYTENLAIKPFEEVLHVFIDIVSKNGQLMLNISPRADGVIPEDQREVLTQLGAWMDVHGEAIYGTRPFVSFGEGPTRLAGSGHFVERIAYTKKDVRYTRKDDKVYALITGWPDKRREVILTTFGIEGAAAYYPVTAVRMLGTDSAIEWERTRQGLIVKCPNEAPPSKHAIAFELTVEGLPPAE